MPIQKNTQEFLEESTSEIRLQTHYNSKLALNFVSNGVGCFALTLVQRVGILPLLIEKGFFSEKEIENSEKFKNTTAIKAALLSLCLCGALTKNNEQYQLTNLGYQLAKHIGLVTMVFEGYGELIAKGVLIASGRENYPEKYINGESIALSSIQFGEKAVDPEIINIVKDLSLKGTICDLGCGSAHHLLELCKATSLPGLGLDASPEAVNVARKTTEENPNITIELADGANLEGVWEDVEVLIQCFMTHDIFPDEKFIQSLSSYRQNFPNMKYFIVIDIVAPEENFSSHMPGYDYIHGLLGIETRRYERFISLFSRSGYNVDREVIIDMPNTYLWVLRPHI